MDSLFYWTGLLVWLAWAVGIIGLLTWHLGERILVRREAKKSLEQADRARVRGMFRLPFLTPSGMELGWYMEAQTDDEAIERLIGAIK